MKKLNWKNRSIANINKSCIDALKKSGVVVTPTKVGYIIVATDRKGLERKFELKERPHTKPGVILCSSIAQVKQLAKTNDKIMKLYQNCWDQDLLLGCILPWREAALHLYVPNDNSDQLIMSHNGTSCFVIKYGQPSEDLAKELWEDHNTLVFASSANPSGTGNKVKLSGVGDRILNGVNVVVEADDYVNNQQLGIDTDTRYEQGVMVSMVDILGELYDPPVIIRKGLDLDKIMIELSKVYNSFCYRHGDYC